MSKRYYIAQVSTTRAGWQDLQDSASLKQKEADDFAELFAKKHMRACRTVRKPKGWEPEGNYGITSEHLDNWHLFGQEEIASQALESRKNKNGK